MLHGLQLWSCPFGSLGSVHAWQRQGTALRQTLARLFHIPYALYVDDLFGVDRSPDCEGGTDTPITCGTARLARWVLEDLLGWDMDCEKSVSDMSVMTAFGVVVEYCRVESAVYFSVSQERADRWIAMIQDILRSNSLSPARAKKIAGKLSWGTCQVFGRGARVYLAPLHRQATGSSSVMTMRLRAGFSLLIPAAEFHCKSRNVSVSCCIRIQRDLVLWLG